MSRCRECKWWSANPWPNGWPGDTGPCSNTASVDYSKFSGSTNLKSMYDSCPQYEVQT